MALDMYQLLEFIVYFAILAPILNSFGALSLIGSILLLFCCLWHCLFGRHCAGLLLKFKKFRLLLLLLGLLLKFIECLDLSSRKKIQDRFKIYNRSIYHSTMKIWWINSTDFINGGNKRTKNIQYISLIYYPPFPSLPSLPSP